MNVVALIGNLAADPELRYTQGGRAVCSFRVAISRPGGDHADFFTVVAWERQAEVCSEYLTKGRRVGVEGRLHHSTWEVEGERRSKVEIVATRVELLGGPRKDGDRELDQAETAERDPASTSTLETAAALEPVPA